ncbi:MAG: tetratricopeptide repeat protein [Deltaproteobacteria bacterium]|nr:tetratricopeptide repeat protein [Deltaproteobacteria bacterium]
MFPHHKLDWTLKNLERQLQQTPDDTATRLVYARACLSRARFHEGGEAWYSQAFRQASRVLNSEPTQAEAMILAGHALLGLERATEQAAALLDKASHLAPERADLHLALGLLEEQRGARHLAVQEFEVAVSAAPNSWETHYFLGQILSARAGQVPDNRRLLERSQYHMVRALDLGPSESITAPLLLSLGTACVAAARYEEAQRLFTTLLKFEAHQATARYYLGLVSFHLGRFQNANLYLRKHMDEVGESSKVLTLLGMSYLSMGQVDKARSACSRAHALDAHDPQPEWVMACTLLEDGQEADGLNTLKKILREHPDHMEAYGELARHHQARGNTGWLVTALQSEVASHDHLPTDHRLASGRTPRQVVRARVRLLMRLLGDAPEEAADAMLQCLDHTEDEGLRAELWEATLQFIAGTKAKEAAEWLERAGHFFSPARGRELLLVADRVPERSLIKGLQITEEDLQAAAVDRFGSHFDIATHRQHVERLRQEARAWQALLLLAIATHGSTSGRNLLTRWARDADPELITAAQAALVMMGERGAASELESRSAARGSGPLLDALRSQVTKAVGPTQPRPVSDDEDATCSTCGRRVTEVGHMLAGQHAILCDRCMVDISQHRIALSVEDPSVSCGFCERSVVEVRAVYAQHGTAICSSCLDTGLGLVEREAVERFLASV